MLILRIKARTLLILGFALFLGLVETASVRAQTVTPVCDRTPQVRDALVTVLGATNCMSITESDLRALRGTLDLRSVRIARLMPGDFSGLIFITGLLLSDNELTTLPEGGFESLSSLSTLFLGNNRIHSLPENLFGGPPEVTVDRFSGRFRHPEISNNPWNFALSVENILRVEESEGTLNVTVTVTEPLEYDLTLQVSTADGTATAGEDYTGLNTTLTLSRGETRGTISIDIVEDGVAEGGELFELIFTPSGTRPLIYQNGELTALPDLSVFATIAEASSPVCDRTPQVRDALVRESRAADCMSVTESDLADIRILNFRFERITELREGDFGGLSSLRWLFLNDNELSRLPEGVFSELNSLEFLQLDNNNLEELPERVFNALRFLRNLCLNNNRLASLPERVFSGLSSLRFLDLGVNRLGALLQGVFSSLNSLDELMLNNNRLATLPRGIFDNQASLTSLNLRHNSLNTLPGDIFGELHSLRFLNLWDNELSSLPPNFRPASLRTRVEGFSISRNPWDFELLVNDATVAESEGLLDMTVRMTEPLDYDLTLNVSFFDSGFSRGQYTATLGDDFRISNRTLTIARGETTGTVSIEIIEDGTVEGDETFRLVISSGPLIYPGAVRRAVGAQASVTIREIASSVTVSPARVSTLESGSSDVFTVVLDAQPTADVEITVTSGDASEGTVSSGGAASGEAVLNFTPADWSIPKTVIVTGVDDDILDGDAEYTVALSASSSDPEYMMDESAFVTATNGDDDSAALIVGDVTVAEDAGSAVIAVTLNNAVEGGFRVRVLTQEGTAEGERADYEDVVSNLDFSGRAGETQTLVVPITNNVVAEGDETFTVRLDRLRETTLDVDTSDTATVTIIEDGATLAIDSVTVNEDAAVAVVAVWLNRPVSGGFTVDAFTTAGSATAGSDYTAVAGETLAFTGAMGETRSFSVRITDDAAAEDTEMFTVSLRNLSGAAVPVAIDTHATVTITDNDRVRTMSVCDRTPQVRDALVRESRATDCASVTAENLNGIISLNLRFEGLTELRVGDFDGLGSLDLLLLNDNELAGLPVDIFRGLSSLRSLQLDDNKLSDLPEGAFNGLSGLELLCLDGNRIRDLPEGVFAGLTILGSLELSGNSIVSLPESVFSGLRLLRDLNLSDNALATLPEGIFSFLSSLDDLNLRGNGLGVLPEGIFSGLNMLDNLNLRDNLLGSLPNGIIDTPPLRDNFLISRNPWIFALFVSDTRVAEREGILDVTVRMTEPLPYDLTLSVLTADGTAVAGEDYTAVDTTLVIPMGRTSGTVSVPIIEDGTVEGDETFELTFSDGPLIFSGGVAATGLSEAFASAVITISGFASVTVDPTRVTTSETGSTDIFTVVLDSPPTDDVAVAVTSGDTTEGTVSSIGMPSGQTVNLSFSVSNWDTPQTVTVTGVDDNTLDGDIEYEISLSTSSSDPDYMMDNAAFATATNTDDDNATLTVEDAQVMENEGVAIITVELDNAVASGFRVRAFTREDTASARGVDYEDATGILAFAGRANEAYTFTVPIIDDNITEEDETFTVGLEFVSGAMLGVALAGPATVTIEDDDDPVVTVKFVSDSYTATEGGADAIVEVELSAMPRRVVTVEITHTPGNGADSGDYTVSETELTFAPTDTVKTVTVRAVNDNVDDNGETVMLGFASLSSGVNVTAVSGENATTTVAIEDDDVTVSFGSAEYSVNEGDTVNVEVRLSETPVAPVTVEIEPIGGTASAPDDYRLPVPPEVTFEAGASGSDLIREFTVAAVADTEIERVETVELSFGDLPDMVAEGAPFTATVTIRDLPGLTAEQRKSVHEKTVGVLSRGMAETVTGLIGSRLGALPNKVAEITVTKDPVSLSDLKNMGWERIVAQKIVDGADRFNEGLLSPDIGGLMAEVKQKGRVVLPMVANDENDMTVWGASGGLLVEGNPKGGETLGEYDGDLFNALVGIDGMVKPDWRVGVAFSYGEGELDYKAAGDASVSGEVKKTMYGIHPYLSWNPDHGLSLWWIGGYGLGDYDISERGRRGVIEWNGVKSEDWMTALGAEKVIVRNDDWDVALRAKGLFSHVELEGAGDAEFDTVLPRLTSTNWRLRLEGEGGILFRLDRSNATFRPYGLASARLDGGDVAGKDKVFFDAGGGLQIQTGGSFVLDVSAYTQVFDGDTREHSLIGVGSVSFDIRRDGKGFHASAERAVGSGVPSSSWKRHEFGDEAEDGLLSGKAKFETEVGYDWETLKTHARSQFEDAGRSHALGFDFVFDSLTVGLNGGYREKTGDMEAIFRAKVSF